jgi:hypothetical protein
MGGDLNGSILRKVQGKEGNEQPAAGDDEEQQAGNNRHLPDLWNENVQNRRCEVIFAS